MGTPRFHRRKQSTPGSNQSLIGDSDCESYMSNSTSTDSEKKSWFKDVWNSVNQETQYSIIMDEQNPQKVKNQLIQVRSQINRQMPLRNTQLYRDKNLRYNVVAKIGQKWLCQK